MLHIRDTCWFIYFIIKNNFSSRNLSDGDGQNEMSICVDDISCNDLQTACMVYGMSLLLAH